jgi:hypothetical protein
VIGDEVMLLRLIYAMARVKPIPMLFLDLQKKGKEYIQLRYEKVIVFVHFNTEYQRYSPIISSIRPWHLKIKSCAENVTSCIKLRIL